MKIFKKNIFQDQRNLLFKYENMRENNTLENVFLKRKKLKKCNFGKYTFEKIIISSYHSFSSKSNLTSGPDLQHGQVFQGYKKQGRQKHWTRSTPLSLLWTFQLSDNPEIWNYSADTFLKSSKKARRWSGTISSQVNLSRYAHAEGERPKYISHDFCQSQVRTSSMTYQ